MLYASCNTRYRTSVDTVIFLKVLSATICIGNVSLRYNRCNPHSVMYIYIYILPRPVLISVQIIGFFVDRHGRRKRKKLSTDTAFGKIVDRHGLRPCLSSAVSVNNFKKKSPAVSVDNLFFKRPSRPRTGQAPLGLAYDGVSKYTKNII